MTAISTAPPSVQVDENLPCLRCGYNLRTLSPDARCPECSASIASSLDPTLLRNADPSWTNILILSLTLLLFAGAIELAGVILSATVLHFDALIDLLALTPTHFAEPLFWVGVFILTTPERRGAKERRFSLRRILRISAFLTLFTVLVRTVAYFDAPFEEALSFVTTMLMFMYLLQLARRTGVSQMVRYIQLAIIAVAVAGCLWLLDLLSHDHWAPRFWTWALWIISIIYIWLLFVLFMFRRTLVKCISFARQHWQFCSPLSAAGGWRRSAARVK